MKFLEGRAPTLTGNQTIAIDGDKLVVVDDGKIIGDPITLDAAAQGELSDLQARADLQGEFKPEYAIDLSGEDMTLLGEVLGGGATLTGNQTIAIDGDKLVVVDDGKIIGDPITLDAAARENTDLQARADLQGELKPEDAIDLSGEDMTLLGEVLGGEAPTLTGNQTIAIDGDKLVVVDDGKIIGDPITLDAAAQGELSDLQARADLRENLSLKMRLICLVRI